ncbi:hypothetical protein F444_18232 [Phytophthora nicotianae P1976]|uniref:Uncharacterized protein n=1 Tax=Phytophthora nicotianae P1976 TaxID=1317066 RepID=A0A080ZC23_PHYNI|nr:hypothetical protein F444_18232 [Phytophthora nicotianae P1976]
MQRQTERSVPCHHDFRGSSRCELKNRIQTRFENTLPGVNTSQASWLSHQATRTQEFARLQRCNIRFIRFGSRTLVSFSSPQLQRVLRRLAKNPGVLLESSLDRKRVVLDEHSSTVAPASIIGRNEQGPTASVQYATASLGGPTSCWRCSG